ncbi:MAG: DNA mismatch repair protein MutS, partial [Alphaproteobacteria bacterium]|nr:DNA mismatch repair protein MutS [Alphaproteobacteria bacterium]
MSTVIKNISPTSPDDAVTPLLAQYLGLKAQHQDCLLFFRLGDFYELFFEDAVKASKALDIALTRRGQMQGQDVPMCGVPVHAYENYLSKLIKHGFRVAICEQTESPAEAKKRGHKSIVTRDVVRIVTPGTITEDSLLDSRSANFLACLMQVGDEFAVAWLDLAAGEPGSQSVSVAEISGVLARINPSELILPQRLLEQSEISGVLEQWKEQLAPQPNSRFDSENARRRLAAAYKVNTLESFGDFSRAEVAALGSLIDYVSLTQKSDLSHLSRPSNSYSSQVAIDASTRKNLELVRTQQGERRGSLLASIDRTQTGAGARLLALRLMSPLTEPEAINKRLASVEFMVQSRGLCKKLRDALRAVPDLERALARLALMRGGPRDLASVRNAIAQADTIRSYLLEVMSKLPEDLRLDVEGLGDNSALHDKLDRALVADLPMLARDGGFIARGYSSQLDELVELRDDSRRLIAGLQQKYAQQSGVSALKIRHNQVIGYYIEVTPLHADKLMAQKENFIHRQSLASAVRFTTVELGELERRITEAADKALAVEMQLFSELVEGVMARLLGLRKTAAAIANIDVVAALAELAVEQNYVKPVVDGSLSFKIVEGRHPVVEQALKNDDNGSVTFVGNDCDLAEGQRLWLLTGPNMAGKSTFLRQNALIAIMAQMGSF